MLPLVLGPIVGGSNTHHASIEVGVSANAAPSKASQNDELRQPLPFCLGSFVDSFASPLSPKECPFLHLMMMMYESFRETPPGPPKSKRHNHPVALLSSFPAPFLPLSHFVFCPHRTARRILHYVYFPKISPVLRLETQHTQHCFLFSTLPAPHISKQFFWFVRHCLARPALDLHTKTPMTQV